MPVYVTAGELPAKDDVIVSPRYVAHGRPVDAVPMRTGVRGREYLPLAMFDTSGNTLPAGVIAEGVRRILEWAREHPERTLFVPWGPFLVSGISDEQAGAMFGLAGANVKLPYPWQQYVEDIRMKDSSAA